MEKILLVEDDLFLRELYRDVLENAGYTVLTATDGEEGLRLAKENADAKLMLLDIMLPKLHGMEVLRYMKADQKTQQLPVVLLTNMTDEDVIQESLRLGAFGYLVKVRYTPQQIVEKVRDFINFHNQHQQ